MGESTQGMLALLRGARILELGEPKATTLGPDLGVAQNAPQPSVGRIVHFYTRTPGKQFNGAGEGPYPAIVTQVWSASYVNLKVLPSMGEPYDVGSVSPGLAIDKTAEHACWWEWPPKV